MSALGRDFFKAKLAKLPAIPPAPLGSLPEELDELDIHGNGYEDDDDDDDYLFNNGEKVVGAGASGSLEVEEQQDDSSSSASSTSSTSTIIAPPSRPELTARRRNNLSPIPWNHHFSENLHLIPTTQPSSRFSAYYTPISSASGPLFVTHHGAGSSGLSFGVLASEIRKILPEAGIFSIDCRGHGGTTTADDTDFHLSTLSQDLFLALTAAKESLKWDTLPPIVLVGHSLGGAVITDLAKRGLLGDKLLAYAVLDVVEGSAMDALQSMQSYLMSRPTGFGSVNQGIEWHVRSRTIRNGRSARVSVPGLLWDYNTGVPNGARGDDNATASSAAGSGRPWQWRTDLRKTQPFWEDWFIGLSKKFLEARGGKLLILAGTDRLDRELTIGQMQGKYQLLVLPETGHFVHEDAPEKTAAALVEFYKRNDRSAMVLPKKVWEM